MKQKMLTAAFVEKAIKIGRYAISENLLSHTSKC